MFNEQDEVRYVPHNVLTIKIFVSTNNVFVYIESDKSPNRTSMVMWHSRLVPLVL